MDAIDIGQRRGPVDAKLIERAGGGEHLQQLVDEARIDGAGEFGDVLEEPRFSARREMVDGVAADIAQAQANSGWRRRWTAGLERFTDGGSMRMPMRALPG